MNSESTGNLERAYFDGPNGKALVWYCIYGDFPDTPSLEAEEARGLPDGLDCRLLSRDSGTFSGFIHGPFGSFLDGNPALAEKVRSSPRMLWIRGEFGDGPGLDYLAATIGIVTALGNRHGVGILDPQTLAWWTPEGWREAFHPFHFRSQDHVVILQSEWTGGTGWFHTRGMRKFSRPDISISGVPAGHEDQAVEIITRFIQFQAYGGEVPDGQEIRMKDVPPGMVCRRAGSLEDEDFNNFHLSLEWPAVA